MKVKQCADIFGSKQLKCASWNNYNQEKMKKRRYKFEVKNHDMPTIEEIIFFR